MTRITSLCLIMIAVAAFVLPSPVTHRPAHAASETVTTTLYPGLNLVGWLGPPVAVSDVFADIPQLVSARADINGVRRLAHREIADRAERLEVVDTGQGYWFTVAGDRPIRWSRPVEVDADQLQLRSGSQLISWSGRDGVTLDFALRGLSDYVSSAWSWDAEHRVWHAWPANHDAFTDLLPVLNKGDAFGVMLREPVVWRQPSGELPEIEFLGEVPDDVRAMVVDDVRFVIGLFAEQFGVEADPGRLKITVPARPQDLFGPGVTEWPPGATIASIPFDLSQPVTILMPASEWALQVIDPTLDPMAAARGVLVHEYFHALQRHLAGDGFVDAPNWLAEGGPTWLMEQLSNREDRSQEYLLEGSQLQLSQRSPDHPRPDHGLGYAVTRMMVERFGPKSYFNLWRNMQISEGSSLDWRQAIESIVGMPLASFNRAYEDWIRRTHPWLEVQLDLPESIDPAELSIYALGTGGRTRHLASAGDVVRRVALVAGSDYQFAVIRHAEDCSAYRQEDGGLGAWDDNAAFQLRPSQVNRISIVVPQEFCTLRLSGHVEHLDGSGRGGGQLSACSGPYLCQDWTVEADGSFDVAVPAPGEYVLAYQDEPDGCAVYYSDGGMVSGTDRATRLDLAERSAEELVLRISDPLCGMSIRGRLLNLANAGPEYNMNGIPENQLQIWAFGTLDGVSIMGEVADDGRFQVAVPRPGSYTLQINPLYSLGGPDTVHESCGLRYHSEVRIWQGEHTEIDWELPTDFCRWRVSGTVVTPNAETFSGLTIRLCVYDLNTGYWACDYGTPPNPDGSFAMFVPYSGNFHLRPSWYPYCFEEINPDFHVQLDMNGSDINSVTMTLPESRCVQH